MNFFQTNLEISNNFLDFVNLVKPEKYSIGQKFLQAEIAAAVNAFSIVIYAGCENNKLPAEKIKKDIFSVSYFEKG